MRKKDNTLVMTFVEVLWLVQSASVRNKKCCVCKKVHRKMVHLQLAGNDKHLYFCPACELATARDRSEIGQRMNLTR